MESAETEHPGNVLHRTEGFRVVECAACGFAHLDPKPKAAELERFYEGAFYDEANPDYLAKTEREIAYWNRVVFAAKENKLRAMLGGAGRILDIGCCGGFLLRYFADHDWKVLGLEPSRTAFEWATRRCRIPAKQNFFELIPEAELGIFDAVHMAFVMEHVRDPKWFLEKVCRITKPGGVICIEAPNDFNALQGIATSVLSKEPYWICAPDHINYFSFDSLEGLLKRCGLQILRRDATFPLELFLLMGDDYIGNESVGLACHERRMRMEERLHEGGAAELLETIYADLARRGLGRQMILYAQKRQGNPL
jgi:SAM-dependent methyltransferase